jgi:hypothetical protein
MQAQIYKAQQLIKQENSFNLPINYILSLGL